MNKHIELIKSRDFGDILGDSVKILKENFGVLSLGFLIYVLPVVVIGGYLFILMGPDVLKMMLNPLSADEMDPMSMLSGLGTFYLGIIFAAIMLYLLVYGFFLAYENKEPGEKVSIDDIGGEIRENFLRLLLMMFVLIGVMVFPMLLIAMLIGISPGLGALMMFAAIFGYIYVYNVLQFSPFIFLRERLDITETFRRAFYLVKGQWWITFGIIIVASLIASFVSYIFAIPAYVMMFASAFSAVEGVESSGGGTMMSLGFILMMVGSLFCSMYTVTAQVLQYYNLLDQKDGSRLMDKIDEIGTQSDSLFDNEGDF